MTKTTALRRFLLPCFNPSPATSSSSTTTVTSTKKRLSTSLRDDILDPPSTNHNSNDDPETSPESLSSAPPRPSRTMVIGTIFGHRRGPHVWFCTQPNRLSPRLSLLVQIPLSTQLLVKEMQCGLVRIALESHSRPGSSQLPTLDKQANWAASCNGRKLGFAVRKKPSEAQRAVLESLRSITVGAGVVPVGSDNGFGDGSGEGDELMYMRANYECIVGGPDSQSFHLISPDQCPGQELSIFLLRSR